MATHNYVVQGNNPVSIKVNVSASGVSHTTVRMQDNTISANSGEDPTGLIPLTPVGNGNDIKGTTCDSITTIDLGGVDPTQWQSIFDNLTINYTLSGGMNGDDTFGLDADDDKGKSTTGKIIVVQKLISFN